MNVEDEFNMTSDQLREALRFYVGQSFNLLRKNREISIQLIDKEWRS